MKLNAVAIYPKDVQLITGRGEAYSRNVIRSIKKSLGKQKHQLVTYHEFCEYMGIPIVDLESYLRQ